MSDINDGHYPTRAALHAQIDACAKENAALLLRVAELEESDRYIEHAIEVVSAATFEVEVSVIDGIKSLAGKRDALATENASLREQVARLSAPAVGLAESGPYTLTDVALIEANRGRPYGRLRETVVERDDLREQVATLTQQRDAAKAEVLSLRRERSADLDAGEKAVEVAKGLKAQRDATAEKLDAAKADAARLREAGAKLVLAYDATGITGADGPWVDYSNTPRGDEAGESWRSMIDALSGTDSVAWLESKISERTKELETKLNAALEALNGCDDESACGACSKCVVAATNDAARAELKAKDLRDTLECLNGLAADATNRMPDFAPRRNLLQVVDATKTILGAAPGSEKRLDAMLRATVVRTLDNAGVKAAPGWIDDVVAEVKRGAA